MSIQKLFKTVVAGIFCSIAAVLGGVHAEMTPTPLSGDARLVTFEYNEENTYLVLAKPKAHTHIIIPEGELLESVMAGDTASWEINPTKNLKHLFIKPKYSDTQTTLTIVTSSKTFQLVIRSTGEGRKWYQQVSWEIPKGFTFDYTDKLNAVAITQAPTVEAPQTSGSGISLDPTKLNYNYSVDGNHKFKPSQVFDDGKMVWMKMPADIVELPAMFAKDAGDLVLVNYIVKGDFILVQQLVDVLVLKIGQNEVNITRGGSTAWSGPSNRWNK